MRSLLAFSGPERLGHLVRTRAASLFSGVALGSICIAAACSSEQLAPQGPAAGLDGGVDAPAPIATDAAVPDASEEKDAEVPYEGPPAFDGGPMASAQVIDLPNPSQGLPVSFVVPPGTLGFHVMVESTSSSQTLAVVSIQSPSGVFVHQNATPEGGEHPTSLTIMGTVAAAQVPQGAFTGATVEAGTWKVVFTGKGTLSAKVSLQTTPDGTFHGGNLNLNVFIPSGLSLEGGPSANAKGAWATPAVRNRIEAFYAAIYELYGLRNGTVRFFDIPAKYRTISDEELGVVFKETKLAPPGQALSIVLSEVAPDGFWWGVAAGIPGAANTPGTDQSGLALASVPEADATMEGYVLAHEAGHFMGLNHTTEADGDADPLPDTPRCTTIQDGNLEACPDFSNIMFVSGAAQAPILTSPFQRRVIQGSPMFQAFTTGAPPPAAVLTPRPNARALDYGRLFGHPGVRLSRAERLILGATCKHASNHRPILRAGDRADVAHIAEAESTGAFVRNVARHLLVP